VILAHSAHIPRSAEAPAALVADALGGQPGFIALFRHA